MISQVFFSIFEQQQLIERTHMLQKLITKVILIFLLLHVIASLNCQYNTQGSCLSTGCIWSNNTCSVGNGNCQDGFIFYTPQQECVECSSLGTNNCTQICSQYYYSGNLSSCVSCSNIHSKCTTCNSTQCFTCASGFSVNQNYTNQCLIDKCKIRYCQQCESDTACYLCTEGYTPGTNGTFCSVSTCTIKNCLYCFQGSSCVTCRTGYLLNSNGTICTLICEDPFCASCSTTTTCTFCLSGYTFNKNTGYCQLLCAVSFCTSCDLSTTCTACASGYNVNNAHTLCSPQCSDKNCSTCTPSGLCIACSFGYNLNSQGICTRAMCYIDNCVNCTTSLTCGNCSLISTLSTNKTRCVQNCLSTISNCKYCLTNSTCGACIAGYQLNTQNTSCVAACRINNCVICLTTTLCSFCTDGYITSTDGTSCIFNCGILNCQTCNSTTTCKTCIGSYTLSSSATSCTLSCSPGFYINVTSATCSSCSKAIDKCATCSISNNTVICLACSDLYYLTSNGQCRSCTSAITNCILCLDPTHCTSCSNGYNLVYLSNSYQCSLPYQCRVANCSQCSINNPLICTSCNSAFYLTNSNLTCTLITCLSSQYYDSDSLTCKCPSGSLLINSVCTYCSIDNCIACNTGGCITCKARYYPNKGKCKQCKDFCKNCTSGSSCLACEYGFTLQNGNCKAGEKSHGSTKVDQKDNSSNSSNSTNSVAICPPGCASCIYFSGSIYCTIPMSGYAIDSNGQILKCDDVCATCASLDYKICTSCYGASTLSGGNCIGCTDSNALSCPKNIKYATSCVIGYSTINGTCRQCAANCLACGIEGASKCDDGGCSSGYVKIYGTKNCTKCFLSCSTCSTYNPSVCLSCGVSNYLSNSSSCIACPQACLSCSSATACTSCPTTSILDSSWCYSVISYPCASQSKSSCTACYVGYSLAGGVCKSDTSCNSTSTCSTCNKNYYLKNKKCFSCQTPSICDYCQSNSPTLCLQCSTGYYLKRSNSQCTACTTGCTQCRSLQVCSQASDGYYLQVDEQDEYTGKVSKCSFTCQTCSKYNECDICAGDYTKIGVSCVYNKNINAKVTLSSAAGSDNWYNDKNTDQQNLANAFINLNQIISALASVAGISIQNLARIIIISITIGSLIVSTVIAADPAQDFTSFSQGFSENIKNIPDFQYLASSILVNGQTTTSSADIGLILGITLPLIILLAVVIIVIKVKLGDADQRSTQQTEKQIQEFQM